MDTKCAAEPAHPVPFGSAWEKLIPSLLSRMKQGNSSRFPWNKYADRLDRAVLIWNTASSKKRTAVKGGGR